jgi:energy-coupling factor transporter ATP-binding protein EcfA2
VNESTEIVLNRLESLKFEVRAGEFAPFDERIPLVSGIAWDMRTAQFVLVAESADGVDADAWKQLIFTASGLRHHLGGTGSVAFGAPVIVGIVDEGGAGELRCLVEEIAHNYVVFNRIDLNLVLHSDLGDREKLDNALAPLLPRCRAILGKEISREEVQRFWGVLRDEIQSAAEKLDDMFGDFRATAGWDGAAALIDESVDLAGLPSPEPVHHLSIKNFRSMQEADTDLADVNIVHGPNGGGKTTLLEALEFVWAGTSQRKPAEVPADEYERHLPRFGEGEFEIDGGGGKVTEVAPKPQAELGRCVLTQDAIGNLVGSAPDDRYDAFLTATGLEIPDLNERSAALIDSEKTAADAALSEAGLPTLPRRDTRASRHISDALGGDFSSCLPALDEVAGLEEILASTAGGAYRPRDWSGEKKAFEALFRVDGLLKGLPAEVPSKAVLSKAFKEATAQLDQLIAARLAAVEPARLLLDAIGPREPTRKEPPSPQQEPKASAVPEELAVRWLGHGDGLAIAAKRFRRDAEGLKDSRWEARLNAYAKALDEVASKVPWKDLEKLAKPHRTPALSEPKPVIEGRLWEAAGFISTPVSSEAIAVPLREVTQLLQAQADDLEELKAELEEHPAHHFGAHADRVLDALCRFELARTLRRAGPIVRASEQAVAELLQARLAPVVRELVAGVVRFEWYFEPLLVSDQDRKIVLGGLATSRPDLDARMLVNSAERTALGLAWFLALHMLQPAERRRVLVLDDPTSGFDAPNQAGFVSTLRTFVRLVRPEQLFIATHDDGVAAILAEELGSVDGWPSTVATLRCQRDADDCSVITGVQEREGGRSVSDSSKRLGVQEAARTS